jgi:alkyl hydroperoxide reductase subunit D
MAMNNVYYRATHLLSNKECAKTPARRRMSVVVNPGVAKADFERWRLAVSAIYGCGAGVDAHEKAVGEAGAPAEAAQAALRCAAIVQSAAAPLEAAAVG